jgi:hypothetical protein
MKDCLAAHAETALVKVDIVPHETTDKRFAHPGNYDRPFV